MEYNRPPLRSTLATTALAVCGLVAAAHVLHPAGAETGRRPARVVTVAAEAAPAPPPWTDPPVRLRGAEPAALFADSAAVLAPRLTMAPPPGALMARPLSSALVAPEAGRKAAADPLGDLIRGLDREG
jgi:hypothetical protein